jgi:hypothetical protein
MAKVETGLRMSFREISIAVRGLRYSIVISSPFWLVVAVSVLKYL